MRAIQVSEYVQVSPRRTRKTKTKKKLTSTSQGPLDLKVSSVPTPSPSPDKYLIEIHSAGTNFFDILQIQGKYQNQPPLPWIGGAEFAGTIAAIPTASTSARYKVGDRVFGATQGAYATHVLAPESVLLPIPTDWTFASAAGLFVTAPTSYGALVHRASIKAGDWVLVHAAAGGVGLAAVQIAKAFGATVIATAGTARKREIAALFGADYVIDYTATNWADEVKALCAKHRSGNGVSGVDIVYDPVGMIEASLKCVGWNARLLVIGFAAGKIEKVALNRVLLKNVSLVGIHWGQYARFETETVRTVWEGIFELVRRGKFRGTTFSDESFVGLESVPAALKALGGRETWGKVVVNVKEEKRSSSAQGVMLW
ncbi:hypothetical protein N7495_007222 [Penicillium taxi]|uniref:uncharacterized protein n=1 Tax=Penicillium taxi TaxID=168475 RepID=UPI002544DFC7|nr:uncharacterized protein N7495_007222 [Penicillium taxi]KAJ5895531.1 hypothetical protein N7495_007222 [Penicillium taxi]